MKRNQALAQRCAFTADMFEQMIEEGWDNDTDSETLNDWTEEKAVYNAYKLLALGDPEKGEYLTPAGAAHIATDLAIIENTYRKDLAAFAKASGSIPPDIPPLPETEICKMLTLSTAHIPEAADRYIRDVDLASFTGDCAHILYTRPPAELFPPEVKTLLDFAQAQGCDYLRLDRDGPVLPAFPVYSW